ncbi:MAG: hypothetical protein M3071_19675, partial [Actinomycetota bacterium]|nr:hypothetical protein [Actinomycetota bacterium]
VLVHPSVAQAAQPFEGLGAEQMRLVDHEHDLFAALGALTGEKVLGLGDQDRAVKLGLAAEPGEDRGVDPAQPDPGRGSARDLSRTASA